MHGDLKIAKFVVFTMLIVVIAQFLVEVTFVGGVAAAKTEDTGPTTISTIPTLPPVVPTLPPVGIYVSSSSSGKVDDVKFDNEDILVYNWSSGTWSMYFDGSSCGLNRANVDAFDFTLPNENGIRSLVLSFDKPIRLPNIGLVDDSDIVLYRGTTPCEFEQFFDGSAYGLTRNSEDINAIGFTPEGDLVISTNGYINVRHVADGIFKGRGQDLWRLDSETDRWVLYFDGSDVDLSKRTEILDGLWIDHIPSHEPNLYLGTFVDFTAVGSRNSLSGDTNDIFEFFDNDAFGQMESMDDFYIDFGGLVVAAGITEEFITTPYEVGYESPYLGYDPGVDGEIDESEFDSYDFYLPFITR